MAKGNSTIAGNIVRKHLPRLKDLISPRSNPEGISRCNHDTSEKSGNAPILKHFSNKDIKRDVMKTACPNVNIVSGIDL